MSTKNEKPNEENAERLVLPHGSVGKIGDEEIAKAQKIFDDYKTGKTSLENRIIANDQWYKLRHQMDEESGNDDGNMKSSAWLFNSLANKHADAMDNYPEVTVLPREQSDMQAAQSLTQILPAILERGGFEQIYSNAWWYKLKNGTAVYGVFWNPTLENGVGDIEISEIELLNLFWEPGIKDIQKSENIFYAQLYSNSLLESTYPQLKGFLGATGQTVAQYIHDETIKTDDKSLVVDWYYKKNVDGKTVVHFCKFCNGKVLYASENDDNYADSGYYDHGLYPFVCDTLFVCEDSICGFGYIDIMKGAQSQIDILDDAIMKNAKLSSKPRYFINSAGSVNEEEFADWSKDFVHVNGANLGEDSLRQVVPPQINGLIVEVLNNKIGELKETSGNRDFSQGATTAGVTAASAITALQEAGGKLSRDMIAQSYNSFKNVNCLVIELIRQFYDTARCFRIVGSNDKEYEFISFDNSSLKNQPNGTTFDVDLGERKPVFDLKVRASKNTTYSRMSQNELALQFFNLGFFHPQNSDVALATLEMMEFEQKNDVVTKIKSNGTMYERFAQLVQVAIKCAQIADEAQGMNGALVQQVAQLAWPAGVGEIPGGNPTLPAEDNSLAEQSRRKAAAAAEVR